MNKLIFLDVETTGKGPDDRLIQVCYRSAKNYEDNERYWGYEGLFKPPLPIKFEAMAVHHITENDIAACKPFKDSFADQELRIAIEQGYVIVAHNAPFDIEMLGKEGIKITKFIDTLKIAQILWDEPSYKLQYLRYCFGLNIEAEAHNAEGDVEVLEALFNFQFKASNKIKTMVMEEFIAWAMEISLKPILLRRISFGKYKGMEFKDIPKDYLQWLIGQKDIDNDLRITCEQFLNPKNSEKQSPLL